MYDGRIDVFARSASIPEIRFFLSDSGVDFDVEHKLHSSLHDDRLGEGGGATHPIA
jgi:hypothetical protein